MTSSLAVRGVLLAVEDPRDPRPGPVLHRALLRRRLAAHLGLNAGEQPLLLIRLGYAKKRLPASPRRTVDGVMRRP
ncbi:hypothetical protein CCR96_02505 [Halochromatium roseum]|nr:hypothetical protein [Halochromatium roseum]